MEAPPPLDMGIRRVYPDTNEKIENSLSIHWLCQTYSCIDWSMVYNSNEIKAAKGESYLANLIFLSIRKRK